MSPRPIRLSPLRRLPARNPSPLALISVVVAVAAWFGCAFLLWSTTSVPSDLRLPDLDPRDLFSAAELARAHAYERVVRIEFLVYAVVTIAVLAAYARWGTRFLRESAAGRIGSGMLLAMLGFALLWLTLLPAGVFDLWWQRRNDLTEAAYLDYFFESWFGLGGQFLFLCLAIVIVMGLAGRFPDHWWIPGAGVFVALACLLAFVYPYLAGGDPIDDPALVADAHGYAVAQGIDDVPIEVVDVSSFTNAPNAEAAGFGPSRKVILWSTILDGRFDDGSVRVVVAHELGHHSRNHIIKSLLWYALFAFPGTYLIARITRRRGGMREPEAVPLALLVLVVLSFLALPLNNMVTRHMEAEADWVALETTKNPAAAQRLFEGFSTELYAEPKPPTWAYLLMESHPTVIQRIAMAEAWKERRNTAP
jgi:STE24 endopeptidase